jgi:hypothetical protein
LFDLVFRPGLLFSFFFTSSRKVGDGMRGRALPLPFGHSWTVPKNRRVDLGLPSRFWTGMGISGAITLGVFLFFAQTPPLMGVWFSVTTGDSKFLGLLMTWNNKNLGVCEYTYLCVCCLYVSL